MVVFLERLNGPNEGQRDTLAAPGQYVIGSSSSATIRIARDADPHVSKRHAVVELTPARVVVRSLASLNPLQVNGQPVRDRELAPGDIIQVGFTRLRVTTQLAVCYVCRGSDPD